MDLTVLEMKIKSIMTGDNEYCLYQENIHTIHQSKCL